MNKQYFFFLLYNNKINILLILKNSNINNIKKKNKFNLFLFIKNKEFKKKNFFKFLNKNNKRKYKN
jgi:hypothetical protein